MIRISPVFPLLVLLFAAMIMCEVAAGGEPPHGACSDCHSEGKELKMVPATLLCLTCHPSRRSDHPLVTVPAEIPTSLPLDGSRTMTCLTCHEPHGKGEGGKMLRKPNEALCLDCHQK